MKVSLIAAAAMAAMTAGASVQVEFAPGKWNKDDWTLVKGPRWDYCHGFVQKDGWIENETPEGMPPEEVAKKCHSTTYSGMVWKEKFPLGTTVTTTTGWDWQMAPLIVIAPDLGTSKDGKLPEFREHWEIVVYYQGLNVWHHYWTPEKGPHWVKAASMLLPKDCWWKPNVKHTLSVKVAKNAKGRKEMVCTCNGYTLQYVDDTLPDEFYGGILGCEGRNFFWDFSAKTK